MPVVLVNHSSGSTYYGRHKSYIEPWLFNVDIQGGVPSGGNLLVFPALNVGGVAGLWSYNAVPVGNSGEAVDLYPVTFGGYYQYKNIGSVSFSGSTPPKNGALNGNAVMDFSKGVFNGISNYISSPAFASRLDGASVNAVAGAVATKNILAGLGAGGATLIGGVAVDLAKSVFSSPAGSGKMNVTEQYALVKEGTSVSAPNSSGGGGGSSGGSTNFTYNESGSVIVTGKQIGRAHV